ncbi:MAG: Stp1/IreP family PP2C-type Ser/Thr phosphatase [Clostridia bacterium]|nr:Stp1/IreP family PP2C-type Ser/Thr phosphatase [Clostridia bacterium]
MKVVALSEKGRVRPVNQDAFYQPKPGETFAVVCDGMGGHRAGDVASQLCVQEFTRWLRCAPFPSEETLRYAVGEANRQVYVKSRTEADKSGMGTTLTAIWVADDCVYLAHVGDSRAYRLRDGELRQISHDHSVVAELMAKGVITKEEAKTHPQRHYITRAVGTNNRVEPEVSRCTLKSGDVWLLCSDGLSNYFELDELQSVLNADTSLEAKAQRLMTTALDRGGNDNITLLIVALDGGCA